MCIYQSHVSISYIHVLASVRYEYQFVFNARVNIDTHMTWQPFNWRAAIGITQWYVYFRFRVSACRRGELAISLGWSVHVCVCVFVWTKLNDISVRWNGHRDTRSRTRRITINEIIAVARVCGRVVHKTANTKNNIQMHSSLIDLVTLNKVWWCGELAARM